MRFLNKLQAVMPDGRHQMIYQVQTVAGLYEIHFTEVFDYSDAYAILPAGILNGNRPSLINQMGGCYEIEFDLVSNIENNTAFVRPKSSDGKALSTIIAQSIVKHYNSHKPYCYTFVAFDEILTRVYRMALLSFRIKNPDIILNVHSHLDPEGRGYAITLKT